MKKIFNRALAMGLVASMLAGCSSSGTAASTASASGSVNDLSAEITVWAVPLTDDFEEEFNDEFLPKFQEQYPNVEVNLEMQTWEGVNEKLQTALSTGDYPDVYIDGAARTASLPSKGVLEEVDDVFNSFDDWNSNLTNAGVVDGHHYLIPITAITASRLNVNMTLAKELGVDNLVPEDHMTWTIDDFANFVKKAAEAGKEKGIYGTYLYAGSSTSDDIIYSMMMSNGATIIDKDTMTCKANSPEAVEVIQTLGDLVKDGYTTPGAATLQGGDAVQAMANRQVVLCINQAASAIMRNQLEMVDQGYMDKIDDMIDVGIPHPADGKMVAASWGANFAAIFKNNDKDKVAASKAFVKALAGDEEMSSTIWKESPTYSPARQNGVTYKNDNKQIEDSVNTEAEWTAEYGNSDFGMLEPYWPQVRDAFYPELQAVYTGEKTAQEAMDSFAKNVDKILEDYK